MLNQDELFFKCMWEKNVATRIQTLVKILKIAIIGYFSSKESYTASVIKKQHSFKDIIFWIIKIRRPRGLNVKRLKIAAHFSINRVFMKLFNNFYKNAAFL